MGFFIKKNYIMNPYTQMYNDEFKVDQNVQYDVVELPSRGIHYPNGKKSVRVSYLTASDENILSSPNLVQTNSVVLELLKRKVLDKEINVNELVEEDKQAILIFLRNTAFGTEYNVTLTDPKTNQEFTITVDLSSLDFKPFNLVPDDNGEYPYFMEKSQMNITFKFMSKKQEDEIRDISTNWNGIGQPPIKTRELEFMIKSINGNRDMITIRNFIETLPIKDAQDFRKHVEEHKPGIDLRKTTMTPSGEKIQFNVGFGVEFFRPFYGL